MSDIKLSEVSEILHDFAMWLNKNGYTDDDIWVEDGGAVARYIDEELKKEK